MEVAINGQPVTIEGPRSVAELLAERGLERSPCAVEVNGVLVPKREHAARMIGAGDRIEIVTLVGGG